MLSTEASALVSVEVVSRGSTILRSALAAARVGIEVVKGGFAALLLFASAVARVPVEVLTLWALGWNTFTALAGGIVEVTTCAVISSNALALALLKVPGLTFWAGFWLAETLAGILIPEVLFAVDVWAFFVMEANALALIKVPNEVLNAHFLLAHARARNNIKELVLALAILR